jgi:MoaA/NifB/PqqE/SkfB family radical SAM enzyme
MRDTVPVPEARLTPAPSAPFVRFSTLWVQVTGTWCNLQCDHCLNASGPRDPWLKPLPAERVRHAIRESEALGVKDIYFTGGEPFLHHEILPLLDFALAAAPTTVLTNGAAISEATVAALAALARGAPYSLEIRVSLDDVDPERNDRMRGRGAWARAVLTIRRLHAHGLLPIVAATEDPGGEGQAAPGLYGRLRDFLVGLGIDKPRVKILPLFPVGRVASRGGDLLSEEMLDGFDRGQLQCAEARVVADGGVYACPILAGLPGARLSAGDLEESFRPVPLSHPACVTCFETGMTCRNA